MLINTKNHLPNQTYPSPIDRKLSLFFRDIKPCFEQELKSHAKQSCEQLEYYSKQWCSFRVLSPIIDPICYNTFYSMAIQTIITHPFLIRKDQTSIDSIIEGVRIALIGPLLAYSLLEILPCYYSGLTLYLVSNIIRSILTRILFLPKNKPILSLLPYLPGIILAAAIRGFIASNLANPMKNLDIDSMDIFFLGMLIRHLFEPQIKKCESINIFQLITTFHQSISN